MASATLSIFGDIFASTDAAMALYITDGAATVAGAIPSKSLLAIYVVLMGWAMIRGMIEQPAMEITMKFLKMAFIVTFATNAPIYASHVANFLYEWPPALAGLLVGSGATSTTELLDKVMTSGLDLSVKAMESGSPLNLAAYPASWVIFLITIITVGLAGAIIIGAKFALTLLLVLGPIPILLLLFERTRHYFDSWLGACVASGLTMVLVSMSADVMFRILDTAFVGAGTAAAANKDVVSLTAMAPAAIVSLIGIYFLSQVPSLASGLGGGTSVASAGAAGWIGNKIKGATSPAARQLGQAGKAVGKSAYKNGAKLGKAAYNKARGSGAPQAAYRRITKQTNRVERSA